MNIRSRHLCFCIALTTIAANAFASDWIEVYREPFDRLPVGTKTASGELSNWEGHSAAGTVFNGETDEAGHFLVATNSWTSFNQGPIVNLDLASTPHDRVRVRFDLYTFGDWRGLQRPTGGPQHRLMFFDNKATPGFAFDTNFSTNVQFAQSWPQRNPHVGRALRGGKAIQVDTTGKYDTAVRWPIELEYASDSSALRFAILCGAAAGSGRPMPAFGIDNFEVFVRSTAPTITPVDRPQDIQQANASISQSGTVFKLRLAAEGRTSVGVFDRKSGQLVRTLISGDRFPVGEHSIQWDGLDNRGEPVRAGEYEWRAVTTPGLTARYVTTIGINPPGGERPVPRRSWVGDHMGGGIVDVDESGIYVGSPITEGLMMLAKVTATLEGDQDSNAPETIAWSREQFYQSGRLTRAATSGTKVFMLHPNGKVRRLNRDNGKLEAEWQVSKETETLVDIDAWQGNLVVADQKNNAVRWLSVESGVEVASVNLSEPVCLAVIEPKQNGSAVAASGSDLFLVQPGRAKRKVASLPGAIGAVDYDPNRKELWAVVDGHRIVRLDERFQVQQTYSDKPREFGPFDPTRFAGVYDIASDLQGGFLVGEPGHPPRRIAHIARDGSVIDQWFGGMSFYTNATFDPADPSMLYGIAPEGAVNVYRIDYDTGAWNVEATYSTGRLGDSMFPSTGSFRAIRRNGELYLYHRIVPAVLRLDPDQRRAVPVAIAGRVLNQGRTFVQFAGSGRGGYPQPWVAAAEHRGYKDLATAPKLYSWADSDGDGQFDPEEFRFHANAKRGVSFHNAGDFAPNGDYIGSGGINDPHAVVRLPVSSWEGPRKAAPRWDWDQAETAGKITADSHGYGSPRGLSVAPDGSVSVAYQAGIMIREHGQYEGGGWPEASQRGSRILGFAANLQPKFAVGRQSKLGIEANSGVLYYPMLTAHGPHGSVVVNDQTKQPAQVWTADGLYVGGFFDNQVDDDLPDGFYRVHGDDNQGATVVTTTDGRTFWLMPYQAHSRLYEITGWGNWQRQNGTVKSPKLPDTPAPAGEGLNARYYQGSKLVLESIEPPAYYERFGGERHADNISAPYKVVWEGYVVPPASDRFQFHSLLGNNEQVAVWVDGRIVHANGFAEAIDNPTKLVSGHKHRLRVEYINPDARAELVLLWRSRVIDPQRLPKQCLFAD